MGGGGEMKGGEGREKGGALFRGLLLLPFYLCVRACMWVWRMGVCHGECHAQMPYNAQLPILTSHSSPPNCLSHVTPLIFSNIKLY